MTREEDQAGAVEERDALLAALGWKTGPFRDALSRKVILEDSAALRPAMIAARQRADEAEANSAFWQWLLGDLVHNSRSGVLGRLWEELKDLRRRLRSREEPVAFMLRYRRKTEDADAFRPICGKVFMTSETAVAAAERLSNRWRVVEIFPVYAHEERRKA